jgi:hypothetical protein
LAFGLAWEKVATISSMAFFWAVDPSPFREPDSAAPEDEKLEPPAPPVDELLLLSEPQAARARAPTRAMPPRRTDGEIFTPVVSFAFVSPGPGRAGRAGPDGRGWRPRRR